MTREEHQQEHIALHRAFDQLVADFLMHHPAALPSETTLKQLMEWSYRQTVDPESDRLKLQRRDS
jgi:hypothetical protein